MPEQSEAVSLADELARVKEAHEKDRERLRVSDSEARKVPSLSAEKARLEGKVSELREKLADRAEEAGALEQEIAALKSEARDFAALEEDLKISQGNTRQVRQALARAGVREAEDKRLISVLKENREGLLIDIRKLKQRADRFDHLVELGVVKGL